MQKIKPYSLWTPEEKIEVSHKLLASLSDNRTGAQCSTVDPGPMSIEEMQLLEQVFPREEIRHCLTK